MMPQCSSGILVHYTVILSLFFPFLLFSSLTVASWYIVAQWLCRHFLALCLSWMQTVHTDKWQFVGNIFCVLEHIWLSPALSTPVFFFQFVACPVQYQIHVHDTVCTVYLQRHFCNVFCPSVYAAHIFRFTFHTDQECSPFDVFWVPFSQIIVIVIRLLFLLLLTKWLKQRRVAQYKGWISGVY